MIMITPKTPVPLADWNVGVSAVTLHAIESLQRGPDRKGRPRTSYLLLVTPVDSDTGPWSISEVLSLPSGVVGVPRPNGSSDFMTCTLGEPLVYAARGFASRAKATAYARSLVSTAASSKSESLGGLLNDFWTNEPITHGSGRFSLPDSSFAKQLT